MAPRIRLRSLTQLAEYQLATTTKYTCARCTRHYASIATTPAPSDHQLESAVPTLSRYPPTQPPSHRDPAYRKSQLIRAYVSLLQTTPLIIFFQHNNLKSSEWVSIRRELASAMRKLDAQLGAQGKVEEDLIGKYVKLEVIKTNMFEPALRITEYFKPSLQTRRAPPIVDGSIASEKDDPSLTHALSRTAYKSMQKHRNKHPLTPVLSGSVAILTLPYVSPTYLKAAFSIIAPQPGVFPAPTRRAVPTYHEPAVQEGLKKLMLLGARIDGQVFDMEGTRRVGSIEGGMDGLRAQLVGMLQGFGQGVVQTLEGAGRSIWWTVEGRRRMLEEETVPKEEKTEEQEKKA